MTEEETVEWESGPWTEEYILVDSLGGGGQGNTFLTKTKSDQTEVAVKILRSDRDTGKARRRMAREVSALQALAQTDAVVPDYIKSNISEALADKGIRPFVVMEYISGRTLNRAIESDGPMGLEGAINFVQMLSETVAIAHSEETVHRDIKPQNIVLKGGGYSAPYLIDFGLSFNAVDLDNNDLTNIHESVGTRFLSLPETGAAGPDNKRYAASDVTLLSGIFFYVLTGKYPEYLSKDANSNTHRRDPDVIEILSNSSEYLAQFFDRAFQYDVENRLQTVGEFQNRLKRLSDQSKGELPDIDVLESAAEVREDIASSERSYQLGKLNTKHQKCFNQFFQYLEAIAGNKGGLAPARMAISSFGNVITESEVELVRVNCPHITLTIPTYRNGFGVCRYFLFVQGGNEVSLAFGTAVMSEPASAPNIQSAIAKSTYEVIYTFFDWDSQAEEFLKKHFNNWFDQTLKAINNMDAVGVTV